MRTLTLKNVPDELYDALKARAARNRRGLNQEAIVQLASSVSRSGDGSLLERIDRHRSEMAAAGVWVMPEDVDAMIDAGRP